MPYRTETIALPSPTAGTSRSLTVHRFGQPGARPKVYIHAALHADELPAVMALHHLLPLLAKAEAAGQIKGEIVVVPIANPIGLNQNHGAYFLGRFDVATRENYNRNFPADWTKVAEAVAGKLGADPAANIVEIRKAALDYIQSQSPQSELSALRWKLLELSVDADYILDLHCAARALVYMMIYKDCLDLGAADLAADVGSAASFLIGWYPDKRTFMTTAGSLWSTVRAAHPQVPEPQAAMSCVIEYRGRLDVSDDLARSDAGNLFRFLTRRHVIDGDPATLPDLPTPAVPVTHLAVVTAPVPGVVVYNKALGERIRAGETACTIIDPLQPEAARARTKVPAPADGFLFDLRNDHLVRPGSVLFSMRTDQPLDRRADQPPQED